MLTPAQTVDRGTVLLIVASAVPPETCSSWLALIEAAYRRIEVTPSPDFVPESRDELVAVPSNTAT